MRYGSVCSGIEAATVAWGPLGWTPAFFSEIEKFPRAVLQHHWPDVPLHGDFTTIGTDYGPIDILVGGTLCQSFSVAGLRKGLADDRGNLSLKYLKLAQHKRPRWLVWENVPGVLSSNGGRDFGAFLGGLVELGYGFAYRVFDAQYAGVPQRRKRVFVVGYLGDWRYPAAVLFERHSLQGHPPPIRKATSDTAGTVTASAGSRRGCGIDPGGIIAPPITASMAKGGLPAGKSPIPNNLVFGGNNTSGPIDIATACNASGSRRYDFESETFIAAFAENSRAELRLEGGDGQRTGALSAGGGKVGQGMAAAATESAIRCLTPLECERLQGLPDNHTRIPWRGKPAELCPDGPRYKAIGNSMAVPCMRWIGERIEQAEESISQSTQLNPSGAN